GSPGLPVKTVLADLPFRYYSDGEKGFLLGDTLALRCYAEDFDTTLGDDTAFEGLALINTRTGTWEYTVGLGYETLVRLDQVADKLYAGTRESLGAPLFQRPMAAYSLRELDLIAGPEGPAANVPGEFVQYDPASNVLTMQDYQWMDGGGL